MAGEYNDPNVTIQLLKKLQRTGYGDKEFSQDHHFARKGKHVTISAHVKYCQTHEKFRNDGSNSKLQKLLLKRLEQRTEV